MTEATPLEALKVAELRELAEHQGVDLAGAKNKADILAAFDAAGAPTMAGTVPYRVTVPRLNARKTPSSTAPVVDVVNKGTTVNVIATDTVDGHDWVQTEAGVWHLAEHLEEAE